MIPTNIILSNVQ